MVHKPKHKVHSFRGLLGDDGQDEINLERQNANLAYRIIKFEVIAQNPGVESQESTIKIYKEKQSSLATTIDFTDPDLLGAALYHDDSNAAYPVSLVVIFDNTLFSRNIYISHKDGLVGQYINYYIEIEEVPVSASALIQIKLGTARRNISGKIGPTPG